MPRPFGNSPHVRQGWEPHTGAYPENGAGGTFQYMGRTDRYDPAWAFDLTNDFARREGAATEAASTAETVPAVAEAAVSASVANAPVAVGPDVGGLSSQAEEAARLRQPGGGEHDAVTTAEVPAPLSPKQRLIDETTLQYQDLDRRAGLKQKDPEYLSKNERGQVLSGVLDTADESGQVHFGLNNAGRDNMEEKLPPGDLHPLLQERLEAQMDRREGQLGGLNEKEASGQPLTQEEKGVLTAGAPGYHSEVYALDAALKAREVRTGVPVTPDDLSDFLLHNIGLKGKQAGGVPYRCSNCRPLTDGVSLTGELQESEERFHGR